MIVFPGIVVPSIRSVPPRAAKAIVAAVTVPPASSRTPPAIVALVLTPPL